MPSSDAWTNGRLLTWTTDYLREQGSDSARLDAEVLLAHARQCDRIDLYTSFEEDPGERVRQQFRMLVKQRAAGTPVAYLVGQREFFSLPFQVTPDVLIPRPETEFVVMAAIDTIQKNYPDETTIQLADIGTGSGAIAIAIAKQVNHCLVRAIDCSPQALQVACQNIAQHQLEARVLPLESDLLAAISADEKYHVIVSNPPYISQQEYEQLDNTVRDFEPRNALLAGPTGLEIYQRLIPEAATHLHPQGWLILETSPFLQAELVSAIKQHPDYHQVITINDLAGQPRVVTARYRGG